MNDDIILPPALEETEFESISSILANEAKEKARLAQKPIIDLLEDAIELDEDGVPVFTIPPGERVIIERVASVLPGKQWLDTKVYTVETIDGVTGNLMLWDDAGKCHAMSNYLTAPKVGYRFKVPPAKGGLQIQGRKRGRPRKVVPLGQEKPAAPVQLDENGQPVKKKRGRPPGTKNRPKEVMVAERKAKAEMKAKKKAKRKKA
jgi:hypothetical protein